MAGNGFNEELEALHTQRASAALVALTEDRPMSGADRLAAALDTLATGVTDEAALWEKYKKKGWQSTKTTLLAVAGKLQELAKQLDALDAPAAGQRDPKRGIEPGGDPNQPGVAPRSDPDRFVYRGNGQPAQPSEADIAAHAERLAAERDAALHEALAEDAAVDALDEPDADETGGIPMLSTQQRIAAGLPVVPTPESLAIFTDPTPGPSLIDTAHQEARVMLEERRADADPFSDPLPPGGVLADVEPITFAQLMTPAPVPADLAHWSYSQLSDLDECEVKYAARKIFGKPSLPQWALVGGRAFHASVEIIERRILAPGSAPENWQTPAEIWATAFQTEIDQTVDETHILPQDWRSANGGKENFDWWRVEGEGMVKLYVEQRTKIIDASTRAGVAPRQLLSLTTNQHGVLPDDRSAAPVLELELSLPVPGVMGTLEFRSIIDQAWLCADGTLLIVDLKSGRQLPSGFDTFQLGSQALVLAHHLGIRPPAPFVKACYYDARKGIFTEPINALERHTLEELVYRMHTAEHRRRQGIYRPNVSTRGCTGCGVRRLCPLVGA